jgi:hypothetical protein
MDDKVEQKLTAESQSIKSAISVQDAASPVPAPPKPEDQYLTGLKLWLLLGGIGLAIFLFALDISIIATVWVAGALQGERC